MGQSSCFEFRPSRNVYSSENSDSHTRSVPSVYRSPRRSGRCAFSKLHSEMLVSILKCWPIAGAPVNCCRGHVLRWPFSCLVLFIHTKITRIMFDYLNWNSRADLLTTNKPAVMGVERPWLNSLMEFSKPVRTVSMQVHWVHVFCNSLKGKWIPTRPKNRLFPKCYSTFVMLCAPSPDRTAHCRVNYVN